MATRTPNWEHILSARGRLLLALVLALLALPASARADTHTYTYRFGPILLSGYSSRLASANHLQVPPVDGFITKMHAQVVNRDNVNVPQQYVMLHHVAFVNSGHRHGQISSRSCRVQPSERFYGTGEENQSLVLPPGYGYPVNHDDRWRAGFMVMNHRFLPRRVWIQYTVTVSTAPLTPVHPYWINVAPCLADPIFSVPGGGAPGSTYTKSVEWTAPISGRIVAVGAHMHGGAQSMILHEPDCGDRPLTTSVPEYGLADDPIYHVLPQIHEPGPRFDTYTVSPAGVPIRKGERLRLDADYDDERPHARVMGIIHIYVADGPPAPELCPPLPTDEQVVRWEQPYRSVAPKVDIPITVRGKDGQAVPVTDLPGGTRRLNGDGSVNIRNLAFSSTKLSIPLGANLTWNFVDHHVRHDVTYANGPRAFGSQYLRSGRFARAFTVPGTYRIYCTFHPADMSEIVVVRPH